MQTELRTNFQIQYPPKGNLYSKYIKRILDFTIALILLITFLPVLIVVYIAVRVKLGSPVLFKQERPGYAEKIFTLYKFRTMTDKKDEHGDLLPDEIRLTKFGKFLRSTSLDELPELINILKGDMSFVGPRPLLIRYLPYYRENERIRSLVKPGITGLSQISGRNALNWDERFIIDVNYTNQISFMLDIKILLKTVIVVFKRKDILVGTEHILKDLDVERREEFANV